MIIVITGPTGVGKTKLSIELAKKYNAEVINADSMQVYKELNIGTAKIKEEEKEHIPHHLFDIMSVYEDFNVYNYQKCARNIINNILKKNKNIVLVGGTGLYIKACLYDYKFNDEECSNNYDNLTNEELYNKLLELDNNIIIDKNNRRRLVRAINYYINSHDSINNNNTGNNLLYDNVIFIGLTTSRDILYNKINKRVDNMINEGLLEEVKSLYDKNIYTKPIINGIGYKELYSYFDNIYDLEQAIFKIKQNSRKYAKRQYTFFRNKMNIIWFNTDYECFDNTVKEVEKYIESLE